MSDEKTAWADALPDDTDTKQAATAWLKVATADQAAEMLALGFEVVTCGVNLDTAGQRVEAAEAHAALVIALARFCEGGIEHGYIVKRAFTPPR